MGVISLVVLGITIIQLVTGLLSGSALIYYASRHNRTALLLPAYGLSILGSAIVSFILVQTNALPSIEFGFITGILGCLISFHTTNFNLLLGAEKIKIHNILTFLQSSIMLSAILVLIFVKQDHAFEFYFFAFAISYAFPWFLSFNYLELESKWFRSYQLEPAIKDTLKYGFMVQVSSLLQLGNYRMTYYVVKAELGLEALGVLSVAMQIAESVWIIPRSMSMVQMARLSNSDNVEEQYKKTIMLVKLSLSGTFLAILAFFLIPSSFYVYILGEELYQIKGVIMALSPGIFAVAITTILSAFFSGTGKIQINLFGSLLGLIVVVITSYYLIGLYELRGAAFANTFAYGAAFIFSLLVFIIRGKVKWNEFLPQNKDVTFAKGFLLRFLGKQQ